MFCVVFLLCLSVSAVAQGAQMDSLNQRLQQTTDPAELLELLQKLAKVAIQVYGISGGEVLVIVFDHFWQASFGRNIEEGTRCLQLDFTLENITSGEYFVRVTTAAGTATKLLVVTK